MEQRNLAPLKGSYPQFSPRGLAEATTTVFSTLLKYTTTNIVS